MGPKENDPHNERTILAGEKERQGDYVFTANVPGEYRFCFDNTISTFADKMIDFEIAVENEPRAAVIPSKQGSTAEQTSVLEDSIMKVSSLLSSVSRSQKYFRTRENRNFSTVRSTERRIWNFSLIESGLMVGMAGLQVFVVRMFFTGGRKGSDFSMIIVVMMTDNIQVTCKVRHGGSDCHRSQSSSIASSSRFYRSRWYCPRLKEADR